ncbi:SMI1/KNR4 family protein [Alkalihalobacillus deserti]|uniref:SMI1/KNR4 family protein n=1 Tax=Alkalihalobacillus deserti TaxID=2879466 RepID=UPI001D13FABC|nr:SMI1/KNR4 family protein [Alkalihalobacillus deserti]
MSLRFYEGINFWKSPSEYKPGVKLTKERLQEVEQLLGVKLPMAYIQLMEAQNGGELSFRYVLFEDGDAAIIPYLYEIDIDHGIGLSPIFIEECSLPEGMVLLTGDLHSWLALDYRKNKQPSVIYITESDSVNGTWEEYPLATTFAEFTGRLFLKDE